MLLLVWILDSISIMAAEPNLVLQNGFYRVEVHPEHGLIMRVYDKRGELELLQEPRLADNFKFSLPLPGKAAWQATEANYILGKDQRLTSHELNATDLVLHWGSPLKNVLGILYDVSAAMTIRLVDQDILFSFTIKNNSAYEIGEVYYPILGGSLGLGNTTEIRRNTELVLPGMDVIRKVNIFHTFTNAFWLGVFGAEQAYGYPNLLCMPWMEWNHPSLDRGVYIGAHDPIARYKVIHFEMLPGIAPSRVDGNWPRADELHGQPAGVKMSFVFFPYQPPGQHFQAAPVVLRCHAGDWKNGSSVYREWFRSQYPLDTACSDWQDRTIAIQQCGPVPFRDLPRWAEQGAAVGLKGLLLTEWKIGGSENGIPCYELDPQLGSESEFADAMRQCHAMGVRVALSVKLQPATQLDTAYQRELFRYACRDRWGIVYSQIGWPEGPSVTGGFGRGESRVWLNPGHPGMRQSVARQWRKLAELGVDGIHLRDFFGSQLDFNPTIGKTADRASWEGGIESLKEIRQICRDANPEFSISTDTLWDHMLSVTRTCSLDTRDASAMPATFPSVHPTFTMTDPGSVYAIHNAIRYGGRLCIAPANGQPMGGLAGTPITGYLKAVLDVREILSHTLCEGEYLGSRGLRLKGLSSYGMFRNNTSGLHTAVLVNPRVDATELELDGFEGSGNHPILFWQPCEGASPIELPKRFVIPGRQVAILTEEAVLERLAGIPLWNAPILSEKVIFDLASPDDLDGWTLEGTAFSISALGALGRKPTLNSLTRSGETAVGTALSPPFFVDPRFDWMTIEFQGGWSQEQQGQENLILKLQDTQTNAVLEQITPPGTHVLSIRKLPLDKLAGKSIRILLVDQNRASSYAWIGLRNVSLIESNGDRKKGPGN